MNRQAELTLARYISMGLLEFRRMNIKYFDEDEFLEHLQDCHNKDIGDKFRQKIRYFLRRDCQLLGKRTTGNKYIYSFR